MTLDSLKLKNEINSIRSKLIEEYSGSNLEGALIGIGLIQDYIEGVEDKHRIAVTNFLEMWE